MTIESGPGTQPESGSDVAAPVRHSTDAPRMRAILDRQRAAFLRDGVPSAAVRRQRIDRLIALVLDNMDAYSAAIAADFGTRSRTGTLFAEIMGMLSSIEHTRSRLGKWMRPAHPSPASRLYGIRAEVRPSPLGVVGIIGPWNFPLSLVIWPAASAFAAGNRVMIKMSEITGHTAELTRTLAPKYFDEEELAIVTGGPATAAAFAELPFDHLFFTGSTKVGQLVQLAAAKNLVPVTLELGGKNPVVVGPDVDISRAAARIAKARMVNGGQVCVCPDQVFVPEDKLESFLASARRTLGEMFPSILANEDYTACVDPGNYDRVLGLVEDARDKGAVVDVIAPPGEQLPDRQSRKVAPTLVHGVRDDMRIVAEEVFGPVLVVRTYRALGEVIEYLNGCPSPLVAYWYGADGRDFRTFVAGTRSGGVSRNDFAMNMFPADAPFGGVGNSGTGAYHGKAGFDTFTHHRTIVGTDLPFSITTLAAPPFARWTRSGVDLALEVARRRTRRRLRRSTASDA